METCGAVADYDPVDRQADALRRPPRRRTPTARSTRWSPASPSTRSGSSRPDIGGGFGNKVGIYPGYVLRRRRLDRHRQAGEVGGGPLREPDVAPSFARDYTCSGEIAATQGRQDPRPSASTCSPTTARSTAPRSRPSTRPASSTSSPAATTSQAAHCKVTGVYTNKAPGGVAYACSFRITEAVYLVERMVDCLADELEMDPAELRLKNLIRPEQFPYTTQDRLGVRLRRLRARRCGWRMEMAGYDELRREQAEKRGPRRADGHRRLVLHRGASAPARASTWTSSASAWPTAASCGCTRPARPCVRLSVQTQGQGHETTFAQIVAEELGIPPEDIEVVHGDTDQHAVRARHLRQPLDAGVRGGRRAGRPQGARTRRRIIAAGDARGARPDDLEWEKGRWSTSRATRRRARRSRRSRCGAHGAVDAARGRRGQPRRRRSAYNPPNLTYPFGAYICVVDVDPGTGAGEGAPVHRRRRLRHPDQPDDRRGPGARRPRRRRRHGADGDDRLRRGRQLPRRLVHGLPDPDLDGVPDWETGQTVTPSPHHPIGAKGVGESATVGSPPAVVNAVIDALKPFGVRHADMPLTPARVWRRHAGPPDPHRPGDP